MENKEDEHHISRLGKQPDHLVPGRMMEHAVIGVHDDHHDLVHEHRLQNRSPEDPGNQRLPFRHDQKPDQKADENAEIVHEHKVDMLGPAAQFPFIHVFTCFPLF